VGAARAAIVWFRQDLRLADNPALLAAMRAGGPVIPVFIWAPEEEGNWPPGAASRWWLHQSLTALASSLGRLGSRLVVRRGPTLATLRDLAKLVDASAVFWNRRYEPAVIQRDRQVEEGLRKDGLTANSFNGSLLFEPWTVQTQQGKPYQVFTPYWRACLAQPDPPAPEPVPASLQKPRRWPTSLDLAELCLEPAIDWAGGLQANWTPGEAGASDRLAQFLDGPVYQYAVERNRPDRIGTARLSPHLHFGEISVREVWSQLNAQHARRGRASDALRVFKSELGWREFAHHLLYHFPHTAEQPLHTDFARFPWRSDAASLRAWHRGRTGYPIVDAGMRELWHTGWMHNRVRMITASFLVKDLLISWQQGAAWFWDTLVDADLANNTLGWQWTAGCGADAAPYFRVFNPVRQGEQFDPGGAYVRHWISELKDVPGRWIHHPWDVIGHTTGTDTLTYPCPIVNHAEARTRALEEFRHFRQ
jgi:deoxyribodipyrimidine photo-lyase